MGPIGGLVEFWCKLCSVTCDQFWLERSDACLRSQNGAGVTEVWWTVCTAKQRVGLFMGTASINEL
jgi:hypothetical protein